MSSLPDPTPGVVIEGGVSLLRHANLEPACTDNGGRHCQLAALRPSSADQTARVDQGWPSASLSVWDHALTTIERALSDLEPGELRYVFSAAIDQLRAIARWAEFEGLEGYRTPIYRRPGGDGHCDLFGLDSETKGEGAPRGDKAFKLMRVEATQAFVLLDGPADGRWPCRAERTEQAGPAVESQARAEDQIAASGRCCVARTGDIDG